MEHVHTMHLQKNNFGRSHLQHECVTAERAGERGYVKLIFLISQIKKKSKKRVFFESQRINLQQIKLQKQGGRWQTKVR